VLLQTSCFCWRVLILNSVPLTLIVSVSSCFRVFKYKVLWVIQLLSSVIVYLWKRHCIWKKGGEELVNTWNIEIIIYEMWNPSDCSCIFGINMTMCQTPSECCAIGTDLYDDEFVITNIKYIISLFEIILWAKRIYSLLYQTNIVYEIADTKRATHREFVIRMWLHKTPRSPLR